MVCTVRVDPAKAVAIRSKSGYRCGYQVSCTRRKSGYRLKASNGAGFGLFLHRGAREIAMLSDTAIKNAKPRAVPFKLVAGKGLYLEIRPSGSKLWRYRYRRAGKENVFALGEYVAAPRGETEAEADTRKIGGGYTISEAGIERERCRRLV